MRHKTIKLTTFNFIISYVVPLLITFHFVIYNTTQVSSAVIVYGIKLTSVIVLISFINIVGSKPLRYKRNLWILAFFVLVTSFGFISPLLTQEEINWFYYWSDGLGLIVTYFYFSYTNYMLEQGIIAINEIFIIISRALFVVSIAIIANYFVSGGNKVSIPPEIHYGLAIYYVTYAAGHKIGKFHSPIIIAIISIAVVLSIFRVNMMLSVAAFGLGFLWVNIKSKQKANFQSIILITILVIVISVFFGDIVTERAESLSLSGGGSGEVFEDKSANQRFLEVNLVLIEVNRIGLGGWLFGKGFGAEYFNIGGIIEHYPFRQHHAHVTIFALLLRNGILGLTLFFLPLLFCLFKIFSSNKSVYFATIGLVFTYIALMTDQYVYWGLYFGVALGVWLFSWRNSKKVLL